MNVIATPDLYGSEWAEWKHAMSACLLEAGHKPDWFVCPTQVTGFPDFWHPGRDIPKSALFKAIRLCLSLLP